jgi:AraC-like DNA-binding protein
MPAVLDALARVVPANEIRLLGHDEHTHDVPHLLHVVTGVAQVLADGRPVVLRARENLWLAAGVPHAVRLAEGGMILGPMLSPGTTPPSRVHRMGIVPALTSVMIAVLGAAPSTAEEVRPFRAALDDLLTAMATDLFPLILPAHPVARTIAREVSAAAAPDTLERLAARHGMSVRQVQRVFQAETGLPFSRWRARARVNIAVGRLRAGESLTSAARASGYLSRSGLLRALSRESGIAAMALAEDPLGVLESGV